MWARTESHESPFSPLTCGATAQFLILEMNFLERRRRRDTLWVRIFINNSICIKEIVELLGAIRRYLISKRDENKWSRKDKDNDKDER